MLKILILAFISINFVLVKSTSFEETRDCLKGPTYWCASVSNSKRCGAFKHCLQTVWSRHNVYLSEKIDSNDHSCDSCVKCLHGDLEFCPTVEMQLDEISDLYMANLPTVSICKLVNGCQASVLPQTEQTLTNSNERCLLHPRVWCDSLDNARKCSSVDYCRTNVWKKQRPMVLNEKFEKSEASCGFCIWTFNKLHEVLESNLTEFNVEQYLKGACSLFPNKQQEQDCTNAIEKNLLEIYNLLRDNTDPGIICRVIKLCDDKYLKDKTIEDKNELLSNDKLKIKIKNPQNAVIHSSLSENKLGSKSEYLVAKLVKTNGIGCELCSIVLSSAKYLLSNNKTEEEVLLFIEQELCSRLGSLNSTCVQYVETEGLQILFELAHNVDPSVICQKIGLCMSIQVTSSSTKRFFDINIRNSLNCTLCKMVMTNVKNMLESQQLEGKILDYVKLNLCLKTGKYQETCKTVINAYGPVILSLIANDLKPDQLCEIIGMCEKPPVEPTQKPQCILCEFILATTSKFITQNSSASEVERWLEYVCNTVMPETIRAECKAFVDEYEPVIVSLIANQVKPDKICQFIGLCDKPFENTSELQKLKLNLKVTPQCVLCEFVLTTVSKFITTNSSAAEVEKWLDYVCNTVMPETIRAECTAFVNEYEPLIASLIVNQIKPDQICKVIRLCNKSQEITPIHEQVARINKIEKPFENPVYCLVCEYTVKFLEVELKKNSSEEAMTNALNNACKFAPGTYKEQCESIVNTYGMYLVQLIIEAADPSLVCTQIKLCPQKSTVQEENMPKLPSSTEIKYKTPKATFECQLCTYIAQIAQSLLSENKTEAEITQELEKVCNFFPSPIKDQCLSFLGEYGPYVVELLANDLNPEQVCEKLKFCKNSAVVNRDLPSIKLTKQEKIVPIEAPKETFECQICIYVAEVVGTLLSQNKTEEEITQELQKICNFFPSPIKDQCQSFVDEYGPYVVALLANEMDPQLACEKLKLCKTFTKYPNFRDLITSIRSKQN